jgi:hypothetical protein
VYEQTLTAGDLELDIIFDFDYPEVLLDGEPSTCGAEISSLGFEVLLDGVD